MVLKSVCQKYSIFILSELQISLFFLFYHMSWDFSFSKFTRQSIGYDYSETYSSLLEAFCENFGLKLLFQQIFLEKYGNYWKNLKLMNKEVFQKLLFIFLPWFNIKREFLWIYSIQLKIFQSFRKTHHVGKKSIQQTIRSKSWQFNVCSAFWVCNKHYTLLETTKRSRWRLGKERKIYLEKLFQKSSRLKCCESD